MRQLVVAAAGGQMLVSEEIFRWLAEDQLADRPPIRAGFNSSICEFINFKYFAPDIVCNRRKRNEHILYQILAAVMPKDGWILAKRSMFASSNVADLQG
jgi:hypothetical protein